MEVSEGVAKTEVVHSSALSSSSTSRVVVGKRQGVYTVNREHASYLHRYLLGLFNGNYSTNSPGQIGSSGRVLGEATSSVAGNDDAREVVGNITSNIALGLTNAYVSSSFPPPFFYIIYFFNFYFISSSVTPTTLSKETSLTNERACFATLCNVTEANFEINRLRASPNAGGRVILASGTATTPGGTGDRVISIHWPYLSFLIIQVSATVIFLLGIMIQTAVWDVPVLKGDQLAGLVAVSSTDKARLEDYMEDEREGITAAADKETGGEEATGGVRNRGRRGLKGVKGRFVDKGGEWGLEVVVDLGNGVHNRGSNGEVFGGNNGNGNGVT